MTNTIESFAAKTFKESPLMFPDEKHLSNTLRLRLCYETPSMVSWSKELFRGADLYTAEVSQRFQAHAENADKLRKYASQQKSRMSKAKGGQAQLEKVHTLYIEHVLAGPLCCQTVYHLSVM